MSQGDHNIPKTIHLFWFGGGKLPAIEEKCVESWRKLMPDYRIKVWNEKNFDLNVNSFVRTAADLKKWAFVTDYARLHALYHEGGIYMDTDVYLLKSLQSFSKNKFFSSVETLPRVVELRGDREGTSILSALLGSVPRHPFVRKCMEFYDSLEFEPDSPILVPTVIANIADEFGFQRKNEDQSLREGMTIYRSEYFCNGIGRAGPDTFAIHMSVGSWRNKPLKQALKYLIKRLMLFNRFTIRMTIFLNSLR